MPPALPLPTASRRCATTPMSGLSQLAVSGSLGGKVGVAPRLFLKKLVSDVLDRSRSFPDSILAATMN